MTPKGQGKKKEMVVTNGKQARCAAAQFTIAEMQFSLASLATNLGLVCQGVERFDDPDKEGERYFPYGEAQESMRQVAKQTRMLEALLEVGVGQ